MKKSKQLFKMDEATRMAVKKNIFPAAHSAIENWDLYPWHNTRGKIDTHLPYASQALSLDVFGTLKMMNSSEALDAMVNAIANEMGIQPDTGWKVELEWCDEKNCLKEPRRTQVDVKLQGRKNLLFLECKFKESDGGPCSQPDLLSNGKHKGQRQCNGAYMQQTNPVNGISSSCALTGKKIRYWELIPEIFNFDSHKVYENCPFKGGWYQWMRNLVLCYEVAKLEKLHPHVGVVYVDIPEMPFSQKINSGEWGKFRKTLKDMSCITAISYQRILELGLRALKPFKDEHQNWTKLNKHVSDKISTVVQSLS